jgi:glyoxylase-like metal-dependent hydrolase (beta-lactamase superfamily II)
LSAPHDSCHIVARVVRTASRPGRRTSRAPCERSRGVHRVEDAYTNWYLLEEDGRLTIGDTGVPSSWDSLAHVLPQIGRATGDVEAVVLTHGHFDTSGSPSARDASSASLSTCTTPDVELTRRPLSYKHERPRSYYFATQWPALPIVASLLRHRAFWPRASRPS